LCGQYARLDHAHAQCGDPVFDQDIYLDRLPNPGAQPDEYQNANENQNGNRDFQPDGAHADGDPLHQDRHADGHAHEDGDDYAEPDVCGGDVIRTGMAVLLLRRAGTDCHARQGRY
jgi:hypothetical protein